MAEVIQGHNGRVPSTFCPKLGLVVGAPHTDAAQFPYRAPQTHEMSSGRQFPGAYGLRGADPVDLGRVGTVRDGRGRDDRRTAGHTVRPSTLAGG